MVFLGQSTTELVDRIHGGIDLAPELALRSRESTNDFRRRESVTNDEQIDVARRPFLAGRNRSKDESDRDPLSFRLQRGPKQIRNSKRFANQTPQLSENGTVRIGLIVGLTALDRSNQNPSRRKIFQIPLDPTGAARQHSNDLTLVETPVNMREQQAKDRLPSRPKQDRTDTDQ